MTFLLYLNTLQNEFTNWDDLTLVVENERIKEISWKNFLDILSGPTGKDYLPLKELTYVLDYALWGLNPFGYHLINIFFYALTVVAVYLLLNHMGRDGFAAFVGTALFASHPLHVESVAWISGRKDVLSGAFFFLSTYLYLKASPYNKNPKYGFYFFSLISFLFALASKPTIVILPLCLILVDLCSLKDIQFIKRFKFHVPFWVLTFFSVFITIQVGLSSQTIKSTNLQKWLLDIILLPSLYVDYFRMLFLPTNLSSLYPFPSHGMLGYPIYEISSFVIIISLIIVALKSFFKERVFFIFFAWFIIALIPTSGFIPLSINKADRYLFISTFALPLLLTFILKLKRKRISGEAEKNVGSKISFTALLLIIIFFSILTINRNSVWKNSLTLWMDATEKYPRLAATHNNLGNVYKEMGNIDKAISEYKITTKLDPTHSKAHFNLGLINQERGLVTEAIRKYKEAIKYNHKLPMAHNNLGNIYRERGKVDEAIAEYEKAIEIDSNYIYPYVNLAGVYFERDLYEKSLKVLQMALAKGEDSERIHYLLGLVYEKIGLKDEAFREYEKGLPEDSDNLMNNRGGRN